MSCFKSLRRSSVTERFRVPAGAGIAAALIAAGCSADVARFDSPTFNLTDKGSAAKLPSEPLRGSAGPVASDTASGPNGGAYYPPPGNRPLGPPPAAAKLSALPEPVPTPAPYVAPAAPRAQQVAAAPAIKPLTPAPAATAARPGETIEVLAGDTLFGLAKKHNVSVAELMSANDLKSPAIKPGQRLVLPGGKSAARKPLVRSEPAKIAAAPASASAAAAASTWTGSYTVKSGDSPYAIARQHRITLEELNRVNSISDPRKVMPGTVLKVPGGAATAVAAPAAPVAPVASAPASEAPRVVQTTTKPVLLNPTAQPTTQVAALGQGETATDAETAPTAKTSAVPAGKFRWPAKGKVVSGFGPRTDGTHNDGINITVPLGTDVLAAESGVVAYAGSELKGYGNLVLVRHDNGWVTAYAHNDELLVKRGDKVKRGQAVGKAGKTGTVDQPQVHFELRQGSKPVDPMPHMEKL